VEQSPWEDNSHSASQDISPLLCLLPCWQEPCLQLVADRGIPVSAIHAMPLLLTAEQNKRKQRQQYSRTLLVDEHNLSVSMSLGHLSVVIWGWWLSWRLCFKSRSSGLWRLIVFWCEFWDFNGGDISWLIAINISSLLTRLSTCRKQSCEQCSRGKASLHVHEAFNELLSLCNSSKINKKTVLLLQKLHFQMN
jgi:hypothetical protein